MEAKYIKNEATMEEVHGYLGSLENRTKKNDTSQLQQTPEKKLYSSIGEIHKDLRNRPKAALLIPGVRLGSFGLLFGCNKGGKTIFLESLLMSIAAGLNTFMGYPLIVGVIKCLFISLEEGAKEDRFLRNQIQKESFSNEEKDLIDKNYLVSERDMPMYIHGDEGWKFIGDSIRESEAEIVVIDSLNRLTVQSNADEEVAKNVTQRLRSLTEEYKITLFVINHIPKDKASQPMTMESMSGSRIYGSEADFALAINKFKKIRYFKIVASRYEKDDYETVDQFTISDNGIVELVDKIEEDSIFADQDRRFDDTNKKIILEAIHQIHVGKDGKGSKDIETKKLEYLFEGAGSRMSKQAFHQSLKKLLNDGLVIRPSKGIYRLPE